MIKAAATKNKERHSTFDYFCLKPFIPFQITVQKIISKLKKINIRNYVMLKISRGHFVIKRSVTLWYVRYRFTFGGIFFGAINWTGIYTFAFSA